MALRWCAAGMVEAKKQFRRVNGHLHLRRCAPPSNSASKRPLHASLQCRQGGGRLAQMLGAVIQNPHWSGHPPYR